MARTGAASLTVRPALRGVLGRHAHDFLISGNQTITYLQAHLKTDIGFLQIHHHVIELYAGLSQLKGLGLTNCVLLRITDALQRLFQFAGTPLFRSHGKTTAGNFVDRWLRTAGSSQSRHAHLLQYRLDPRNRHNCASLCWLAKRSTELSNFYCSATDFYSHGNI